MDKKKQSTQVAQLVKRLAALERRPKAQQRRPSSFVPAGQVPVSTAIIRQRPGVTVVRHREFVRDVVSPGADFSVVIGEFANAGNNSVFPWLSNVALQYERYRFRRLRFCYRSASGTAVGSTNTALGVVIIAVQYDAVDPQFSNKQSMESYQGAVSGVPSQDIVYEVDCKLAHQTARNLFVRGNNTAPAHADLRLYDLGSLSIATSGQQASTTLGELWADYEVELYTPRIAAIVGENVLTARGTATPTSALALFKGVTEADGTTLDIGYPDPYRTSIHKPGRYSCQLWLNGTAISAYSGPAAVSGCTLDNEGWSTPSGSATSLIIVFDVIVTEAGAAGGVFTFGNATFAGYTFCRWEITQVPYNISYP